MPRVSDLVSVGLSPIQAKHIGAIANGAEGNFHALTAAGAASQANAYQIVANYNNFTTVTSSDNSAKLPLAVGDPHGVFVIQNSDAADNLNLYPAVGDNFVGLAANAAIVIPPNCTATIYNQSVTSWLPSITFNPNSSASNLVLEWQDYTPTYPDSGSMTFTETAKAYSRYAKIGKTVFVSLDITGTTGGTAASSILVTVPTGLTPARNHNSVPVYVRDATSGVLINGQLQITAASGFAFFKNDVTNYGLDTGRIVRGNFFYEVA